MKAITASLLGTLLLTGCSAQWHLKRAIAKDPSVITERIVERWDTIKIPPIRIVDTVGIPMEGDSSVIDNDSVRVVITRYKDKLVVKTEVKERVVPHYVRVECPPQLNVKPSRFQRAKDITLYLLLVLLDIFMVVRYLTQWRR
jgi:hypothetical protein